MIFYARQQLIYSYKKIDVILVYTSIIILNITQIR